MSNSQPIRIDHLSRPGYDVLAVSGDLDLHTATAFRRFALHPGRCDQGRLVADLREVGFLDSTGVGAIVGIRREAARRGAETVLVSHDNQVWRVLKMLRLDAVIPIHHTLEAAVEDVQGSTHPAASGVTT